MTDVQCRSCPLPQRYATNQPGIGGTLKQEPEDFIVEELPLYEPCGEGEHVYLFLEKINIDHGTMLRVLRQHFGVKERAIGIAGIKDKRAVTRQHVSVHLPGNELPSSKIDHPSIRVHWMERHRNKLRRGHLAGNRFDLRVRDVDALAAPRVQRMMTTLQHVGVPAYFGAQRFGSCADNHIAGAALVRDDFEGMVDALVGRGIGAGDGQLLEAREHFLAGRYDDALQTWPRGFRTERHIIQRYAEGRDDARQACLTLPAPTRQFYANAWQSAVFNELLDQRLDDGSWCNIEDGDLAWKHDSGACFAVDQLDDTLRQRNEAFAISPSGPLWGPKMTRASGVIDERECAALARHGVMPEQIASFRNMPDGARRPLRVPVSNAELSGGVDERGGYVRLAFDLPPGMYATVVLREIMKDDAPDHQS